MIRKTLSLILTGTMLITAAFFIDGCSTAEQPAKVAYENVDDKNAQGQSLYESGDYEGALRQYAESIRTNPIDTAAYIGAARCQLALENYDMAAMNLSAAAQIDPSVEEIYDLYVELSNKSESYSYARTAVALAKRNNVESFLAKVPSTPVLSEESGTYNSRIEVEVTADSGAEIYVEENHDKSYEGYEYKGRPILVTSGETRLRVYSVVDGIPSEDAEARYVCNYEPAEVSFADETIERMVRAHLDKQDGPVTDIDCEKIEYLSADDIPDLYNEDNEIQYYVKSLEDFSKFPNLSSVSFYGELKTDDFSILEGCRRLRSLQFSNCGIKDLGFVSFVPELQYLALRDNPVSDLSPLADCESLTNLTLSKTSVKDLSPLKDLKIENLQISMGELKDLSALTQWKETLISLVVDDCGGKDLSAIGEMTNLERLDLGISYDNEDGDPKTISDISFVTSLTKLYDLWVSGLKDFKTLEPVKSMSQLRYLYFYIYRSDGPSEEEFEALQKSLPNCSINN